MPSANNDPDGWLNRWAHRLPDRLRATVEHATAARPDDKELLLRPPTKFDQLASQPVTPRERPSVTIADVKDERIRELEAELARLSAFVATSAEMASSADRELSLALERPLTKSTKRLRDIHAEAGGESRPTSAPAASRFMSPATRLAKSSANLSGSLGGDWAAEQCVELAWEASIQKLHSWFESEDAVAAAADAGMHISLEDHRTAALDLFEGVRASDQLNGDMASSVSAAEELRLGIRQWARRLEELELLLAEVEEDRHRDEKRRLRIASSSNLVPVSVEPPAPPHGFVSHAEWTPAEPFVSHGPAAGVQPPATGAPPPPPGGPSASFHHGTRETDHGRAADLLSADVTVIDLTGLGDSLKAGAFERDELDARLGGGLLLGVQVMASDGLRWPPMASDGLRWFRMASNGLQWPPMASDGFGWLRMASECL